QEPICPNTRSTWDILWSCLATIFASSWVSVHPNILAPDEGPWRDSLQRLELMFWSVISPEVIVYWAASQWYGARHLVKKFRKYDSEWTTTHGYFIQMGGFVLYDGGHEAGVLVPQALWELLDKKEVIMPKISESEIQDRSKGDGFSKGFVVVQITWFILQCIQRKVQHLDITKLELMTLALSALNVIMYAFWWNKPLNVTTTVRV
ncbi:hypothetical protein GALMADRAFT_42196, partial [Galerina marginata CBS 339.88]